MYIQQLYTNCLAEAAYYIESNGEAAIIDPIRETEPYIQLAKERNAKIKFIFETHFHADFVSGHIDLSKETGAPIIYGPGAKTGYQVLNAHDEEVFKLGNINLKVLHTPGHTLESICILLSDKDNQSHCVFTGDTLFVGDVGRPDLTGATSTLTSMDLAGFLYESLQKKIVNLPSQTIVYPAHGAGSSCGKNIGKETFTTIGAQLEMNYALKAKSKEEFIALVLDGLSAPPAYFFADAGINKNGYKSIDEIIQNNTSILTKAQFFNELQGGATVIDTRTPDEFETASVKGSVNIGLDGQFAIWAATLVPLQTPILLIVSKGKAIEAVTRLARVGFDNVLGCIDYLPENLQLQSIKSIQPTDLISEMGDDAHVLDVRNTGEQNNGVIENAQLMPLGSLSENLNSLDKTKKYLVHCAGGYRSMIACSILAKNGFNNITNVKGGMAKLKELKELQIVLPELV
jgi:glyoxylase-like metal-dependent hydrolase (beta-lactamase superfamily II)/rhodanese-related sulfurtransferase